MWASACPDSNSETMPAACSPAIHPGTSPSTSSKPASMRWRHAAANSSSVSSSHIVSMSSRSTRRRRRGASTRVPGLSASTFQAASTSTTQRPISPTLDRLGVWFALPSVDSPPILGMKPTTPQWHAGLRIEPPLSVPMFTGVMPSAQATPAPVDEPPAVREGSQGLSAIGSNALVTPYIASSDNVVVPSTMPPAARTRCTIPASRGAIRDAWMRVPSVQGRPATGMLPFTLTGRPCSAPRPWPASHSACNALACTIASAERWENARYAGFSRAMASSESVTSDGMRSRPSARRSCSTGIVAKGGMVTADGLEQAKLQRRVCREPRTDALRLPFRQAPPMSPGCDPRSWTHRALRPPGASAVRSCRWWHSAR